MATSKYFEHSTFNLERNYYAYIQNIQHPIVFLYPAVDLTAYTKGCDT
jgi:hypothetical protein